MSTKANTWYLLSIADRTLLEGKEIESKPRSITIEYTYEGQTHRLKISSKRTMSGLDFYPDQDGITFAGSHAFDEVSLNDGWLRRQLRAKLIADKLAEVLRTLDGKGVRGTASRLEELAAGLGLKFPAIVTADGITWDRAINGG